jgi:hypothetical protein
LNEQKYNGGGMGTLSQQAVVSDRELMRITGWMRKPFDGDGVN